VQQPKRCIALALFAEPKLAAGVKRGAVDEAKGAEGETGEGADPVAKKLKADDSDTDSNTMPDS